MGLSAPLAGTLPGEAPPVALGLRANLAQFGLLVLINAFVGGMVGLERAVLPLIAEHDFGLASKSVILSFLVSFGIVKALTNLFAGRYAKIVGRKRLLVAGWLIGLPVPFMIMWAPSWGWITAANVLLGINQGLCWSMTVIITVGARDCADPLGGRRFPAGVMVEFVVGRPSGKVPVADHLPLDRGNVRERRPHGRRPTADTGDYSPPPGAINPAVTQANISTTMRANRAGRGGPAGNNRKDGDGRREPRREAPRRGHSASSLVRVIVRRSAPRAQYLAT